MPITCRCQRLNPIAGRRRNGAAASIVFVDCMRVQLSCGGFMADAANELGILLGIKEFDHKKPHVS